ncbi:54S ribosomal protein [Penicillium longicatenatum]|uniref:54S ribosomal protein n=1 Tax=Penicillium longicatenatum TaxID=1561947 RepID=UPI002546C426|nr:54S ribosomal protein [Penicillium longicatenatum]KAJ5636204.1 54S ribosomal protein [Penicillium longicatenatum]
MVRKAIATSKTGLKQSLLPPVQRKQIFLPEFTIALVRTPHLSPRYAQFRVPLNFNKLDMRDYLQRLYNVGVVRIRSYIEQQPITRVTRDGRTLGQWRRPKSEKRMTVELRDEFVWPQEPQDLKNWEKEAWDSTNKAQQEAQKGGAQKGDASQKPDTVLREAFEKQAKELKGDRQSWQPTWKTLGLDFAHKEFVNTKGGGFNNPKWITLPKKR